jgi:quercetin dioxygenase-like cupin family protein
MATSATSAFPAPLCAEMSSSVSALNKVEVISSHALPDVPGKRVTVVRVSYGPGGFTPPHRHGGSVTAYITKGEVLRS